MKIRKEYSLKKHNTFGIDVTAKEFIIFESEEDVTNWLKDSNPALDNILILGGGSNFLFTKDLDRTILFPAIKGIEVTKETDEHVYIQVGAGEIWDDLVDYCVQKNWGGIENLSLIPGTVGAAPVQNIGAYGIEVKDVFHELEAVELSTAQKSTFSKSDCGLSYRNSFFKLQGHRRFIVTKVTLRLNKQPQANLSYRSLNQFFEGKETPTIQEVRQAIIDIRNSKLPEPTIVGNAGSFFKNPIVDQRTLNSLLKKHPDIVHYPLSTGEVKLAAGWLIEKVGLKGFRIGDAGVYDKQALVLVNYGNAQGHEILDVAWRIRSTVLKEFGVFLEPEVNIIH